jgi:dTMP kinase
MSLKEIATDAPKDRKRKTQPNSSLTIATHHVDCKRKIDAVVQRGVFIVVEGVDGAGKSTQCRKLVEYLQSQKEVNANYMRLPYRQTTTGKIINQYLRSANEVDDHAVHLIFSANRWEYAPAVRSTIASGTSIVMERYAYSGVAYSYAKGIPLDWCILSDRGLPGLSEDFIF